MTTPYIREKTATYYEVKLYLGSQRNTDDDDIAVFFSEKKLIKAIQEYQKNLEIIPVRVTKTSYVAGDYSEYGWEVAAINYPRSPRDHKEIESFMKSLAKHLLMEFNQNRISVTTPLEIILYEDINALS